MSTTHGVFALLRATAGLCLAALASAAAARETPLATTSASDDLGAAVRRILTLRLPDGVETIRVENRDGEIVLSGYVDILPKRQIATQAAQSVPGVQRVTNQLMVRTDRRPDERIAADVETALALDPATARLPIEASAREGVVLLKGNAESMAARQLAGWVASGVLGVREVRNDIQIAPTSRRDAEIQAELAPAYASSPLFRDDRIDVRVSDGRVRLAGEVDTAWEKDRAEDLAWAGGVRDVDVSELHVRHASPARDRSPALSDADVERSIARALSRDPRLSESRLDVSVEGGLARLSGSVSTRRARQAAVQVARHTGGVRDVADDIQLRPPRRTDGEIARDIQAATATTAALANNQLEPAITEGRVTLSGRVDSFYEKWVAENLIDRIPGVVSVENKLEISGTDFPERVEFYHYPAGWLHTPWVYSPGRAPRETDAHLKNAIERALASNPMMLGDEVTVSVALGVATLRGSVDTSVEQAAAVDEAYQAGARLVKNELQIAGSNEPRGIAPAPPAGARQPDGR